MRQIVDQVNYITGAWDDWWAPRRIGRRTAPGARPAFIRVTRVIRLRASPGDSSDVRRITDRGARSTTRRKREVCCTCALLTIYLGRTQPPKGAIRVFTSLTSPLSVAADCISCCTAGRACRASHR
jgi:hypothetical protein